MNNSRYPTNTNIKIQQLFVFKNTDLTELPPFLVTDWACIQLTLFLTVIIRSFVKILAGCSGPETTEQLISASPLSAPAIRITTLYWSNHQPFISLSSGILVFFHLEKYKRKSATEIGSWVYSRDYGLIDCWGLVMSFFSQIPEQHEWLVKILSDRCICLKNSTHNKNLKNQTAAALGQS